MGFLKPIGQVEYHARSEAGLEDTDQETDAIEARGIDDKHCCGRSEPQVIMMRDSHSRAPKFAINRLLGISQAT
jgi:hypothetical protein